MTRTGRFLSLSVLSLALVTAAIVSAAVSASKTVVPHAGFYSGHLVSAQAAPVPVSFYVNKTGQLSRFRYTWVYATHEPGVAPDYTPKDCFSAKTTSTQPKPVAVKGGQFSVKGQLFFHGRFLSASKAEGVVGVEGPMSACGLFSFVASWRNASQPKEQALTRSAASARDSSPLTLSADAQTSWIYGLDSTIQRELTVTNNGPSGIFSYQASQPTNPSGQFQGVCDPQPSFLYLSAGASNRIICSAGFASAVPGTGDWQTGSTHQFPIQIELAQVTGIGQTTPLQTVTLDNSIYVQQSQNAPPNAPMAKPNASLAISVVDPSGRPISTAGLLIENNEAPWTYHFDSHNGFTNGHGSVKIDAYKRGIIPAWQPHLLLVQAPGYADAHVAVSPVAGKATSVRVVLHKPTFKGSYQMFGDYNASDPVGRGATSANGRFLVTVPFGETSPPDSVIARSQLDFFDIQSGKLLWSKLLGVKAMPSVAVSADGQYVAMIDPGATSGPNVGVGLYPNLTLLDHQGKVVWSIPALDNASATAAINGGPVTVKFSPDGRSLAYGTENGRLLILNRSTGAMRAQAFLGGQVRNIAWSADGRRLYTSSGDNNVYALNGATGAVIWKTDVGGWALFWDVSAHEILLTAKTGYALTMLRTSDGSVLWRQAVMNTEFGSVISPDEKLAAVANPTGNGIPTGVYTRSGKLLWASFDSSNAVTFAGNKYVLFEQNRLGPPGSGRGNADFLALYLARSGELVWSVQLPGPAGNWDHGEAGYLYASPDAKTIVAGGAETGHVTFYRGTIKALAASRALSSARAKATVLPCVAVAKDAAQGKSEFDVTCTKDVTNGHVSIAVNRASGDRISVSQPAGDTLGQCISIGAGGNPPRTRLDCGGNLLANATAKITVSLNPPGISTSTSPCDLPVFKSTITVHFGDGTSFGPHALGPYRCAPKSHARRFTQFNSGNTPQGQGFIGSLAAPDGFTRCIRNAPLWIQRQASSGWVTIVRTRTSNAPVFPRSRGETFTGLVGMSATVRAYAPRLQFGNQVCPAVISHTGP